MEIRATTPADPPRLLDIDGTIESADYLHLHRDGESLAICWRLEERPRREKFIEANSLNDEAKFAIRQVVTGAEDGLALVAEHDGVLVASLVSQVWPANQTLQLVDVRVDFDYRRQGLGTVLLYRAIQEARDRELRAVTAQTRTNNVPAARFLAKGGFDLSGLDARLHSNHDLVKEAVALFWYAALD